MQAIIVDRRSERQWDVMRVAVVGHVEWIEFLRVENVPKPGEIVTALELWQEPGGGGGVAAARLAELADEVVMFTALGDDELGRRAKRELEACGVRMEVAWRDAPQRRATVFLDEAGERTITVIGERHAPCAGDELCWDDLDGADAAYFTAGDRTALLHARRAGMLVATSRELALLQATSVHVDAVVGSGSDEKERYVSASLDPSPGIAVVTSGSLGGWAHPGGQFRAQRLKGPREDSYGCGDSFAAGLAYALGRGTQAAEALTFAASWGADALTRRGALGRSHL